jgi:hypothetical protein
MRKVWWILIIVFGVLILGGALFYFTQINNVFAEKKDLEKPEVDVNLLLETPGTQIINEEHVEYIANEIGSYKLHSYEGESAVIVFEMTDIDKKIAVVKNGESYVTEDIPDSIDLIVKSNQLTAAELIESEDLSESIVSLVEEGKIEVELVSDMTTLTLKGFLAVYEELTG